MRIPVGLRETMPWSTKKGGGKQSSIWHIQKQQKLSLPGCLTQRKVQRQEFKLHEKFLQNEVESSSVKEGMTTGEKGKVYGTFKPSCMNTSANCRTLHHRLWSACYNRATVLAYSALYAVSRIQKPKATFSSLVTYNESFVAVKLQTKLESTKIK